MTHLHIKGGPACRTRRKSHLPLVGKAVFLDQNPANTTCQPCRETGAWMAAYDQLIS